MSVSLYINGKEIRFNGSFGWFSGEPFYLFHINLFEIDALEYTKLVTIFDLQIAKLSLTFSVSWDEIP